jgi:integrase/recombinase XerD
MNKVLKKKTNSAHEVFESLLHQSKSLQHVHFLTQKATLGQWAQQKSSLHLSDVMVHFLLNFESLHTRRSYLFDIKEFLNFHYNLGRPFQYINEIKEEQIIQWRQFLNSKNILTQISIRRKLNSISSLMEFCKRRKLIESNPLQFMKRPKKKDESKTNIFTLEEVKKILHSLKEQKDLTRKNDRLEQSLLLTYTVILTLFSVGMRVNELCQLKVKDIEFGKNFTRIRLRTKGNKVHTPIIHEKTALAFKEYLSQAKPFAQADDFVFTRSQNIKEEKPLSQKAVYNMIILCAKQAGISKKVSPHSCRASLATLLHNQGVPIGHIQSLLHHKDIKTTSIYIKKAHEHEESAATQLHIAKYFESKKQTFKP